MHWVHQEYWRPGPQGNDIQKTNVPNLRMRFRYDNLQVRHRASCTATLCSRPSHLAACPDLQAHTLHPQHNRHQHCIVLILCNKHMQIAPHQPSPAKQGAEERGACRAQEEQMLVRSGAAAFAHRAALAAQRKEAQA